MGFILSKLFWVLLSPGNLLVLVLVAGAFMASSHGEASRKAGRRICFAVALLLFLISILPVGAWLLAPLENRFPEQNPAQVTGIVLLGGDEKPTGGDVSGRLIYLDSARRYITFVSLARRYPNARLVYSGGTSGFAVRAGSKQADVAKQALESMGVPVGRMLFEDMSRNTRENAVFAYNLVRPKPDETWLLVTSAYHMPRAVATFRKVGWNVTAAPAGYLTDGTFSQRLQFNIGEHLMEMAWAVHEYCGLLAYRLMGYTDSLWPS